MDKIRQRVYRALCAVLIAVTVGTIGFWILGQGDSSVGDCLYMTVITLSTVGYGEVIPLSGVGRVFTSLLIVFGMGSLIYFGSTVIAVWVEYDFQQTRRRKRMQKTIDQLKEHVIVCGVGTTGSHVVHELLDTGTPFVMIDTSEERLSEVCELFADRSKDMHFLHGDATEEKLLNQAGIKQAGGLVAALRNDKENLYLILSARQMNSDIRIISRATEEDAPSKMLRAGADRVVSPNFIGGMRIASEVIRPQVVEFIDTMLKDKNQNVRFAQVEIPRGSPLVGRKLAETKIRKATDVLVIAVRDLHGKYIYNPGPDTRLSEEAILIVLGARDSVLRLQESVGGRPHGVSLIIHSDLD